MIADSNPNQSKEHQRQLEAERIASLCAGDAVHPW